MGKIYVDFDQSVPRYACTSCSNCSSIMGNSLCSIKNRGCCWYYPKFTLVEIHRMSKTIDGLQLLERIITNPGSVSYQYYIHSKGYFDAEGYSQYLKKDLEMTEGLPEDQTIFFRACPFVKEGQGCTMAPRYRTHVCNFFICSEIINEASPYGNFQQYLDERCRYAKWIDWENAALEHILRENKVNLVSSFASSIELLQSMPVSQYDFPELPLIEYPDKWYKGA
jgi:hypothetical protein